MSAPAVSLQQYPLTHFTAAPTKSKIQELCNHAFNFKANPLSKRSIGKHKTMALLFMNPSLRTRLSTQKAAFNLGLSVIDLNANEGWKLEFEEHITMDGDKAEHVKEAAKVISQYADIIGIRSFPSLTNREKDYSDYVIESFKKYASVPVVNLESSIRHPLQSLADVMTIKEHKKKQKPKVVLTWAPHPKALPQAVPNSFVEWMQLSEVDLVVTHPKGYELAPEFIINTPVIYDQKEAFIEADFIYAKNWSSYTTYGKIESTDASWMVTSHKMALTNQAKFMHCLPVRRNVVVEDAVLDSPESLVIQQTENRTYAAQAVLYDLLQSQI